MRRTTSRVTGFPTAFETNTGVNAIVLMPSFLRNTCILQQFPVYVVLNLEEGGFKSKIGRETNSPSAPPNQQSSVKLANNNRTQVQNRPVFWF